MSLATARPALTTFSEDEQMFRDAVAAFASDEVRPRVQAMERASKIDPELLPKYFELVPELPKTTTGKIKKTDLR